MMTQKLIFKATTVLTLVGLTGGLVADQKPKKNEQFVYRFIKGTTNGLGSLAAYTAQTKLNFLRRAIKNPAVSFTLGAFVAAPALRQTLFSVTPETDVKKLAQNVYLNNKHDYKQAQENVSPFVNPLIDRATPHAKTALEFAEKTAQEYDKIKKQNKMQQKELHQETRKNTSLWATERAVALAQWIEDKRK